MDNPETTKFIRDAYPYLTVLTLGNLAFSSFSSFRVVRGNFVRFWEDFGGKSIPGIFWLVCFYSKITMRDVTCMAAKDAHSL